MQQGSCPVCEELTAPAARIIMASDIQNYGSLSTVAERAPELAIPVTLQVPDSERDSFTAHIIRVQQGYFQLRSPVSLTPQSKLEITIEGCRIRTEVITCDRHESDEFRIGARRIYGPQRAIRAEPRIPVDLSGVLIAPSQERMFARILDMSQSGLGLELATPVAVGMRVSVQFVGGIAFGEIRHCVRTEGTYRAGMRIEEFVVRHRAENLSSSTPSANARWARRRPKTYRIAKQLTYLARRLFCSLVGHDYRWTVDLWERPVLRCTRCEQSLDAPDH